MLFKINQSGSALMMALIFVAFAAVVAGAWSVLHDRQLKSYKLIEQRSELNDLRFTLETQFRETTSCGCLLSTPAFTVNTTLTDGSQVLTVPQIRLNECVPSSPNIVAVDQFISGMTVTQIALVDLRAETPTTWNGRWQIRLSNILGLPEQYLIMNQSVALDPVTLASTPTATRILSCVSRIAGRVVDTCAAGWVRVGPPGAVGTFCVDQNERAALTQSEAVVACGSVVNQPNNSGPAHLCNHTEWYSACRLATDMGGKTDNFEWNTEFGGANNRIVASGGGSCEATESRLRNSPTTFRCCYP